MTLSDPDGFAYLDKFGESDMLIFQHPGYTELIIAYSEIKGETVRLNERIIRIDEIVISANKWEQDLAEIPNKIATISPAQVSFINPQTSADLLESTGQVFVQRSQLGGGSPMIRGFSANRVLLVVDGVRMNNAIFRSGNLQNVINIDPNSLESAEVVFGPGSVTYGSDALGGVMDFHVKEPVLSNGTRKVTTGEAFTRYSSANNEFTGHLQFGLGGQKLSSFTSFTYSDYEDLHTGSNRTDEYPEFGTRPFFVRRINNIDRLISNPDENEQKFSALSQFNVIQKLKYRPGNNLDLSYGFYYSTTSDIPRYDRLIELDEFGIPVNAEWYYGPQSWMMNRLGLNLYNSNKIFNEARIIIAYQNFEESRHDRRFNSTSLRNRYEDVDVYSLNADFDKELGQNKHIFYGFEAVYNDVTSTAFGQDIETGGRSTISTRYPDGGSEYYSLAVYTNYKWNLSEDLILSSGLRYSYVGLNARIEDTSILNFPFESTSLDNGSVNGSLGLVFNKDGWKLNILGSTGFRSPNIDDVGKVFEVSSGVVTVPNEDLRPEYSYNGEIGVTRTIEGVLQFGLTGFYTYLDDALVRRDFTFNGQDSILIDGTLSKVRALVNVGKAEIYGFSAILVWSIHDNLSLRSTFTFSDGRDLVDELPLRHTTPSFGATEITYQRNKLRVQFSAKYNGARPWDELPPSEQDKPHLYTPDGSLSWFTLNLRSSYQASDFLQITAGLENITDQHYRPYSSGISAPGRNFVFALRTNF